MKKLIVSLGILAIISSFSSFAYAENSSTGTKHSEEIIAGATIDTPTYSLKSAKAPVKGTEASVIFSNTGDLRSNVCVKTNDRKITITLYEDDAEPNADDKVKQYVAGFEGYHMKNEYDKKVINSGNIDSADDDTAELYLQTLLQFVQGDKRSSNGTMYNYNILVE